MNRQYVLRFSNGEWWNEPQTYEEAKKFCLKWIEGYSKHWIQCRIFDVINMEYC